MTGPFWGPAILWCVTHRIDPAHGPYPLAELYWNSERSAGRDGWTFRRPPFPCQAPWPDAEGFWRRVMAALALFSRLQDDGRYLPASRLPHSRGALTLAEEEFLRAYHAELAESGTGDHVRLAEQHGIDGRRLMPFYSLLDDLSPSGIHPAAFPWTDFPARYEELAGGWSMPSGPTPD